MTNPIIGMIHNHKDNRVVSVVFVYSPLPGGDDDNMHRHKSKGHHTVGFDTRQSALDEINSTLIHLVGQHYGAAKLSLDVDFPWDGEGIPAMVKFFGEDKDGKVIPMF
jgi:hypothetical protein